MVVRTMTEYMNDKLADRIQALQKALNQAEKIMNSLEEENKKLKDVLANLASENNEGYVLSNEAFDEPVFTA
jgi:peptidoglycan hydrolase CwlO-like protein